MLTTSSGRKHGTPSSSNVENIGPGPDAHAFDEQFREIAEVVRPETAAGGSSAVEYSSRLRLLHASIVAQGLKDLGRVPTSLVEGRPPARR